MTAIEDRLRDLRRSVSLPDLPTTDQVARRGRHRRGRRRAVRALGVLAVLALVPLVMIRLNGDGDEGQVVSGGPRDALATVQAAVGRTSAAGSYEIDLVTTMTQPGTSSCTYSLPQHPPQKGAAEHGGRATEPVHGPRHRQPRAVRHGLGDEERSRRHNDARELHARVAVGRRHQRLRAGKNLACRWPTIRAWWWGRSDAGRAHSP